MKKLWPYIGAKIKPKKRKECIMLEKVTLDSLPLSKLIKMNHTNGKFSLFVIKF